MGMHCLQECEKSHQVVCSLHNTALLNLHTMDFLPHPCIMSFSRPPICKENFYAFLIVDTDQPKDKTSDED